MPLNDAVPSSATDVFKRNAEDTDRLLNTSANVVNRVGTTLESFPSSTGRVSASADAAQAAIQTDVDAAETAKVAALASYTQWNSRGDWATATTYANGDIWNNTATSTWYLVLNAYTSGATVNDDIAGPNVTVLQGAKYGTFEGLSDAVAFVTAHPELFPDNTAVSTSSYRTPAECLALSIPYPDGGGASYVVEALGTPDGYGDHAAGSKQLSINEKLAVTAKQFGMLAGDVDAALVIQALFNKAVEKNIEAVQDVPVEANDATVTLPSNLKARATATLSKAELVAEGSLGSELGLTSDALKGQRVINVVPTGISVGDFIFIKSCINCISPDAGVDQLGSIGAGFGRDAYFAEFCEVVAVGGSSITVANNLLFDYTTTAGPNSRGRTNSTIAKVNFVEGIELEGFQFVGHRGSQFWSIRLDYAKDCKIFDGVYSYGSEEGYAELFARSLDCMSTRPKVDRVSWPAAGTSSYNSFLTAGSTNCGWTNVICNGGYQAVDFTFLTSLEFANPSLYCYVKGIYGTGLLDVATSHPGTYGSIMHDVTGNNCDRAVRSRSKADRVTNVTFTSANQVGVGVFIDGGYSEGTIVNNVNCTGALYGVLTQLYDTSDNPSPVKGRCIISNVVGVNCNNTVYMEAQSANNESCDVLLSNIKSVRNASRGILIGAYNNGVTIEGVTNIGFESGARAGIEFGLNVKGLTIDGMNCQNMGTAYAVRGGSTSNLLPDLTTFPLGNAEAELSITNVTNKGISAGDYTGIARDSDVFYSGFKSLSSGYQIGSVVGRAIWNGEQVDPVQVQNSQGTTMASITYNGKLNGSKPNSVKSDIAAAADLAALKAALDGLFE